MPVTINGTTGIATPDGSASVPPYTGSSGATNGLFFPSATSMALAANGTVALTIDGSQYVGIGTTDLSNTARLRVNGTATAARFNSAPIVSTRTTASTQYEGYGFGNGLAYGAYILRAPNSDNLEFGFDAGSANSTKMTLDTSGNLGIGTSSPGTKLNVYTGSATATQIRAQNTNGYADFGPIGDGTIYGPYASPAASTSLLIGTSNSNPVLFYTNGSERARIDSSGNVGINTTSTSQGKLVVNSVPASQWSIDLAPASSGNLITLANNATYDMLGNCSGMLLLQENTGAFAAIVMCAFGTVSIVWQYGAILATGSGTAGKLNIGYNVGTNAYRFQNLYGSTLYPIICSFKTRDSA